MGVEKRFPAQIHRGRDISRQDLNKLFLYNKQIDALLYAYLQDMSVPVQVGQEETGKKIYQTRVWKSELPTQQQICKRIRVGSRMTLRNRMKILLSLGYVREQSQYYVLLNPENAFVHIPLQTLAFLIDACSSQAIKVYIYLGQGNKMKEKEGRKYDFTKDELIQAVKISKTGGGQYSRLDNILNCLINNGLIELKPFFDGKMPKIKLINFSFYYKKN